MPANLPPQYFEAEKMYRQAKTAPEKIEALERMLSIMPKHKGTDKLHGELRARIAKLTQEMERAQRVGRKGALFYVKKEGAGQAVLVGLPNSGKSRLLASLTQATPKVADYPFTTQMPLPGMMPFENIYIQMVDLPPLNDRDARSWLHGILRNADLLLLVVDLAEDPLEQVEAIIQDLGGLRIRPVGPDVGDQQDIPVCKRALLVANKEDLDPGGRNWQRLSREHHGRFPLACVSAGKGSGLEELKREVFRALGVIRVYPKAPGQEPDLSDPIVLKRGSSVEDVADAIHKDLRNRFKYAQIWGSGKFSGQRVPRSYMPEDGDIVEIHV